MDLMQRVALAVIGALTAGWLTVSAQVPQPFPGRQNPPRPSPTPPQTIPPAPAMPPPAAPEAADSAPTEAALGFPVYPNSQFIASYDAGRGQRYYLFGSDLPFAALVKYYQSALKNRGTLVFDAPATHVFEIGRFPRRDDGVSAGGDGQGLHLEWQRRLHESETERAARAVPFHHSDRAIAARRTAITSDAPSVGLALPIGLSVN